MLLREPAGSQEWQCKGLYGLSPCCAIASAEASRGRHGYRRPKRPARKAGVIYYGAGSTINQLKTLVSEALDLVVKLVPGLTAET